MIRWPGMHCVDGLFLKGTEIGEWARIRHWTVVEREWDRDVYWMAPRWIGWLYRLLPNNFNINLTAWKTEPSFFLINLDAPTWRIGLALRGKRKFPVPAIVLNLGIHLKYHYYIPWGGRLYLRLTTQKCPDCGKRLHGHGIRCRECGEKEPPEPFATPLLLQPDPETGLTPEEEQRLKNRLSSARLDDLRKPS